MRSIRVAIVGVVVLGGLLGGCESASSREGLARRDANIRKTVGYWTESEARRPANLEKTSDVIASQVERDVANMTRDLAAARRMIEADFERFEELSPVFEDRARELLEGDPASFDRTVHNILD